jgi:hypothetical protein
MSILRRSELPLAISGIMVFVILIDSFIDNPSIRAVSTTFQSWAIILAGFALGIGAINLIKRQVLNIQRGEIAFRSAGIIVLLLITMGSGLADLTLNHPIYLFITNNIYSKLYGTGWSFQYFFLFYGLYRAYRIKNVDSFFMVLSSVLLILNKGTIFEAILGNTIAVLPGDWVLKVPVTAGQRAIIIASSIGILLIGYRVLLGKERGFLRAGGS